MNQNNIISPKDRIIGFLYAHDDFDYTVKELSDTTGINSKIVKTTITELSEQDVITKVRIRRHATTHGGDGSASSNVYSYQLKTWMTGSRKRTAELINQKMLAEGNKNKMVRKKVSGFP